MGNPGQQEAGAEPPDNRAFRVSKALSTAEAICQQRGLRLTPIRRRVLELIWKNDEPVGAYALLDQLRQHGKRAMPPTVYRALEFLLDAGLIHRLATLNAFVGCAHPEHPHQGQFLICRACGRAVEMESSSVGRSLRREAEAFGFVVEDESIELTGQCRDCSGIEN